MYARSVNYTFSLDMAETLDIIYIWEFLVNSENVLLLAFVTQSCIFCTFWG